MPISFTDIIKTGLVLITPLLIILIVFKPILINPILNRALPNGNIMLAMTMILLLTVLCYFIIFDNTNNKMLSLFMEAMFYIFATACFAIIVYYFMSGAAPQHFLLAFFLLLIPFSFAIGTLDAKFSSISSFYESKSRITLTNDQVVSANILRNFDKGILVMGINDKYTNFITWDEIKWIKFKEVNSF